MTADRDDRYDYLEDPALRATAERVQGVLDAARPRPSFRARPNNWICSGLSDGCRNRRFFCD